MSSELITAIYAAFAQKESESISGNMRWSYHHRMEKGQFITCKAPLGYQLMDGQLVGQEVSSLSTEIRFTGFTVEI